METASSKLVNASDDYRTSQLVHWFLVSVPRLGTNFQRVTNLTLENAEYGQSMAMYGVLAAIGFATGTLFLLACCCCNLMTFRAWPRYGEKQPGGRRCLLPAKFTVLLLALLGAASFALGFVGELKVHSVSTGACSTVSFFTNRVHLIKHDMGE